MSVVIHPQTYEFLRRGGRSEIEVFFLLCILVVFNIQVTNGAGVEDPYVLVTMIHSFEHLQVFNRSRCKLHVSGCHPFLTSVAESAPHNYCYETFFPLEQLSLIIKRSCSL